MKQSVRLTLIVLAALVASNVWAQREAAVETYMPAGATFYVYYQGFAKADANFEGTALKKILADPQFREFGTELSKVLNDVIKQYGEGAPVTWDDIRVLLDCEMGGAVMDIKGRIPEIVLLVRSGAHVAEVRKLVDRFTAMMVPPDEKAPEGEVDGIAYKQVGPVCVCWLGGDLVLSTGPKPLQKLLRTMKGLDPSIAQNAQFQSVKRKCGRGRDFLIVHWNAEEFWKQGLTDDAPDDVKQIINVLGLRDVASAHYSLSPDAPGFRVSAYVHLPKGAKGVFALLPSQPVAEKSVLSRIDADALGFVSLRFDLARTLDGIEKMVAEVGEEDEFKRAMEEFSRELKFDLRRDLLASLGDEVTVNLGSVLTDLSITMPVRDEAKLRACIDKMVVAANREIGRGRRPGAALEKYNYKGHDIGVFKIMLPAPIAPAFTIENGQLTLAAVPQTLKTLIDRGRPARTILQKADFAMVRKHVSPQAALLTYGESKTLFEMAWGIFSNYVQLTNAIPEVPPHSLGAKFPSVDAILPYLTGSIGAFSRDDEGYLLEGYYPFPY